MSASHDTVTSNTYVDFFMCTWSQVGSLISPYYIGFHGVVLTSFLLGDNFELYNTYIDIEQSGIWAFWREPDN